MTYAITSNGSLLQLPPVGTFDVLMARGLLELITDALVAVILLAGFGAIGLGAFPQDPTGVFAAIIVVWLLGCGSGFLNAVVNAFSKSWDKIWAQLTRLLYFCSGIFYVPGMMPDWMESTGFALASSGNTSRTGSTVPTSRRWLSPHCWSDWRLSALCGAGFANRYDHARGGMQELSHASRPQNRARQCRCRFRSRSQFRHSRGERGRQVDTDPAARRVRGTRSRCNPAVWPGFISSRFRRHFPRRPFWPRKRYFYRPGLWGPDTRRDRICRDVLRARRLFRDAGQHLFGRDEGAARLRYLSRHRL